MGMLMDIDVFLCSQVKYFIILKKIKQWKWTFSPALSEVLSIFALNGCFVSAANMEHCLLCPQNDISKC